MATTSISNNEATIIISPELYKAAEKGDGDKEYPEPLQMLVSSINNTILHIHLICPSETKSIEFVRKVLEKCPSLLSRANGNGDTPLHIAARYGHSEIVQELLRRAKVLPDNEPEEGVVPAVRLLGMKNKKNDTALHEAARNGHLSVVTLLMEQYQDVEYSGNNWEETPLYIAAQRGYEQISVQILDFSNVIAYRGPNGKTALHAAVMGGHLGTMRAIINNSKVNWGKQADEHGWTPLHYAAYSKSPISANELMKYDRLAIYVGDKARQRTPLHISACRGGCDIMRAIISECPDCCAMTDIKGWNVAHYAVASKSIMAVEEILRNSTLVYLMNVKDVKGNTPLHLLFASYPDFRRLSGWVYRIRDNNIREAINPSEISTEIQLCTPPKKEISEWMQDLGDGPLGQIVVTQDWDVIEEDTKQAIQVDDGAEEAPQLEKAKDSHLVVAALIATVSFAAAFTLPGGFKGDKDDTHRGTAILSKNTAFQAFVITDAMAMLLSSISIVIHLLLAFRGYRKKYENFILLSAILILFGSGALILAFITGLYAVLAPSLALAIISCLIGLSFFFFVFLISRGMWKIDYY